jgi:polyhydroxybutyrate depolymerase
MQKRVKRWGIPAWLVLLAGCGPDSGTGLGPTGGDYQVTIKSRDLDRRALVHVPSSIQRGRDAPLLIVLHGTGGTGAAMQVVTELDAYAEGEGMVVAYPDAISGLWTITLPETLDMNFVFDLVDHIDKKVGVDRTRIYLTGFSRGALLAMKMACQRGDLVTAVAPVGAPVRTDIVGDCQTTGAIPAVFFLGTQDQFYPWQGYTEGVDTVFGGWDSGRWWAEKNGCDPEPTVEAVPDIADDGTTVQRWVYGGCPSSSPLEFFAVQEGDHTWPGSPYDQGFLGRVSYDIVASSLIVGFLAPLSR